MSNLIVSTDIDRLLAQPSKKHIQSYLNIPLPFAAFNLISAQESWRKAAKFTSTRTTAISATVKTTTGYCRIMNFDGTLEAVDGAGTPALSFTVTSKAPTSPFNTRIPKFYAIYPCDAAGNLVGDLTYLSLDNNQLTSFDGTGLSSLTYLNLYNNQLTSFDSTGLSSLMTLYLNNNQLTVVNFDGTPLYFGSSYYYGAIFTNNNLDGPALDAMYASLGDGGTGWIVVSGNPGTDNDDPTIATAKGYIIVGS